MASRASPAGVGGLYATLPSTLVRGPRWLIPTLVLVLLGATVISHRIGSRSLTRTLGYILNSVVTVAMIWSLALLVRVLLTRRITPEQLLVSAASLWVSNVLVFASWYWRLDGGGPHVRALTPGIQMRLSCFRK
ncbi:MAG: hypothetical protein ACR2G5_06315 [Pyrinomonadaceae bacterium]